MAPRFDDENLVLHLSVADLLERELGRSLGFSQRGGFERMWLGQAIHSRYQELAMSRDGSYQREVPIELDLEHKGWTIRLHGRMDGLRRTEDGLVVEEIKSVRPQTPLPPSTLEMYQRQAQLYAWMLERSLGQTVAAELVLIELGVAFTSDQDDNIERQLLPSEDLGIQALVRRRAGELLQQRDERRRRNARRRLAAGRLEFPFQEPRPGQTEISDRVTSALEQREHLLVEAATGIGKTVSALHPVMRFALEHDKRVYVLTAKTTQQKMATRVLELLNTEAAYSSLQLRAKARMCANGEVICHEDYCDYAKDYFLKLSRSGITKQLIESEPMLAPDVVYDAARAETVCPFEVSLELGRQVEAVVCDYNYVFEPYVQLSDFSEDRDLGDTILVIDEIHNLVDRSRRYYSPRLSERAARAAAHSVSLPGSAAGVMAPRLEALCFDLAECIRSPVDEELPHHTEAPNADMSCEAELPEDQLWTLRPAFDRAFVDYLEHRRETKSFQAEDPFVGLYFDFLRFLNTLSLASSTYDSTFSTCLLREGGDRQLMILCKDASRYVGRLINRTHTTIGLSATLSPPEFYRDLLGFDGARTSEVSVANPFPTDNRAVVVDTRVDTSFKRRGRHIKTIADSLAELSRAVPGNCLVLFPSYTFLAQVADCLPSDLDRRIMIQKRADGERQRQQILDSLQSSLFGDVLLLAVAGGVFAEGVDYPGDMLKSVAVIGPCLPAVSLEQKLLQEYYDERYDRGFEYAFVVPGMTRVVQAAGRLIRSAKDRGVIALYGRRFSSGLYSRHMPGDWMPDGELPIGDPAREASRFFAESEMANEE